MSTSLEFDLAPKVSMTFNITTFNETLNNATTDIPVWNSSSSLFLFVCIVGAVGNGATLLLILTDRRLRIAPFHVYVINLLFTNFASSLMQYPFAVYISLYDRHDGIIRWYLGKPTCDFYMTVEDFTSAGVMTSHTFMAFTRFWAIMFPLSFRNHHTLRFACIITGVLWLLTCATVGLFAALGVYFRQDVDNKGCFFVSYPDYPGLLVYGTIVTAVMYGLPMIFMVGSIPVIIAIKVRKSRAAHRRITDAREQPVPPIVGTGRHIGVVIGEPRPPGERPAGRPLAARTEEQARLRHQNRDAFATLVLLTSSVTIFCGPLTGCMLLTTILPSFWDQTWYEVGLHMYALQSVCDPFLFVWALVPLRRAFNAIILRWRGREIRVQQAAQ
ncbi:hypothetical protein BV898_02160 [Hypsibius exemplaris]|uniref:G-protein coupled receptors family 1 profile domain-containing protein n=1 Tax=Hypsibius exemplaris TaxID=2072580 RepID=A0A1W0X8U1_HYPEX|nr:hypothetical protein BV898_02160 [Hypsibius exemplaris]